MLCVDCGEEMAFPLGVDATAAIESGEPPPRGALLTRLDVVKQALTNFVHTKVALSPLARFAVMSFADTAVTVSLAACTRGAQLSCRRRCIHREADHADVLRLPVMRGRSYAY